MKNKKKIIIIAIILVLVIVIIGLYGTFALSAGTDNTYEITLTDSTETVTVGAGESKTVIYQITNTNKGVVKYGVAYTGDNITVKVYNDSVDKETDFIDYGETKFIKLYIENTGSVESISTIKTILGYENGGELTSVIPTGYTLVTDVYTVSKTETIATFIINLYNSNVDKDNPVENNSIDYYYASIYDNDEDDNTSGGLMNDRLGGTEELDSGIGNIRYYGANPNNYIYFNCETYPETNCEKWRIIGVFGDKVKIIRDSSIESLAWDQDKNQNSSLTTYNSDWTTSSLQVMLNNSYYNGDTAGTITYYSGLSGGTTTSLNMSSIGLKNDTTRNMIEILTWNLGGYDDNEIYSNQVYEYERGTEVYGSNPTTWTGKIGLMYPSDYGYATDFNECNSYLFCYDNEECYSNDWLFNSDYQWLLTPYSYSASYAWIVSSDGYVDSGDRVYNARGVRPVFYLNSELSIGSGTGTSADPYRISV